MLISLSILLQITGKFPWKETLSYSWRIIDLIMVSNSNVPKFFSTIRKIAWLNTTPWLCGSTLLHVYNFWGFVWYHSLWESCQQIIYFEATPNQWIRYPPLNIGCPSIMTPSKMGKTKNLIFYSLSNLIKKQSVVVTLKWSNSKQVNEHSYKACGKSVIQRLKLWTPIRSSDYLFVFVSYWFDKYTSKQCVEIIT